MPARRVPDGWREAVLEAKAADLGSLLRDVVVKLYGEDAWRKYRRAFCAYVTLHLVVEPGARFGRLVLVTYDGRHSVWKCDCGRQRIGPLKITNSKRQMCNTCTKQERDREREAMAKAAGRAQSFLMTKLMTGERVGMLTVGDRVGAGTGGVVYACMCDCGRIVNRSRRSLRERASAKSCGCVRNDNSLRNPLIAGENIGRWVIVGLPTSRTAVVRSSCCSETRETTHRSRFRIEGLACACTRARKAKETGFVIPNWYWRNVATRRHEVALTHEQANRAWEACGGVCALSGLPISFADRTASLDRINSAMGYEAGNVQWVHKHINKMKLDHPEATFVELCRAVVRHYDSKQAKRARRSAKALPLPFV